MKQLNWATLGCGVIANELAHALSKEGRTLYSVANRTHEKAVAFAQKYGISKVYDNIDDVFYDPDVDIIYISTPHNTHINYLRKALSNGKHVLCEKSITLNIAELDEAVSLAKENNVILAEAMTIYHMPVYKKLNEIIASGQLGRLNLIQVKYAPTGVDEQAGILLMNDAVEMATVTLSLHSKQPKRATLSFDKAYVEIFEYPRGMQATITYTEDGHKEVIDAGDTSDALYYEVRDMEKAVSSASSDEIETLMHCQYTYDVMKIMSDIRAEWGMKYPEEE